MAGTSTKTISDLRQAVASMRRTWTADHQLLPGWKSWIARLTVPSQRRAWVITILWSVPVDLRPSFAQLLSAIIHAQREEFTRPCWCFMRTALRVARILGNIDVDITAQVRRMGRLARWTAVTSPHSTFSQFPLMALRGRGPTGRPTLHYSTQDAQRHHFYDERQGYGRIQWSQSVIAPAYAPAYVTVGTYHPVNFLPEVQPLLSGEMEEVD